MFVHHNSIPWLSKKKKILHSVTRTPDLEPTRLYEEGCQPSGWAPIGNIVISLVVVFTPLPPFLYLWFFHVFWIFDEILAFPQILNFSSSPVTVDFWTCNYCKLTQVDAVVAGFNKVHSSNPGLTGAWVCMVFHVPLGFSFTWKAGIPYNCKKL